VPSSSQTNSTIALLGALAVCGVLAAWRRRWDLACAALIGLGLSAAIWLQASANPASQLLAETLAYTMWWGSELGLWVWLILAWGLWLGLVGLLRPALARLQERLDSPPRIPSGARLIVIALASIAGLAGVVAVGNAVARTAKPDSHVYEYRPVRQVAAALERLIPAHQAIKYRFGPLGLGTQPMEPAIRFFLVRHGDRVLAPGSFARLGSYYELSDRPVQWVVYLRDGTEPQRNMTLAARVHFISPWKRETLSAWVSRVQPRAGTGARALPSG
jgi:hypothetical protein